MKFLSKYPLFLFILPLFFYLLGYTEYGEYIQFTSLLIPFVIFTGIVSLLTWFITRIKKLQFQGAYISLWLLLIFYSFFGDIKDQLSQLSFFSWLSKYLILVPLGIVIIWGTYHFLKSKGMLTQKIFTYINYLMITLCVLQLFLALQTIGTYRSPVKDVLLKPTTTTKKPNIFFVLFDGYPGQQSLQAYFNFDNCGLVNHLRDKKFYVFDTMHSNYNLTINSLSSQLNLGYIDPPKLFPWNQYSMYLKSYRSIYDAQLITFLQASGYSINNLSIFDFKKTKTTYNFSFLRKGLFAMHQKMFHEQAYKNFFWIFCKGRFKIDWVYHKISLHNHCLNNRIIDELTQRKKAQGPQFTYAHLLLPHEPYFTDSMGKLNDQKAIQDKRVEQTAYLDYLKYTNKRMKEISDSLVSQYPESIIILQSDHGWRDYPKAFESFFYNNFMAVYLPDQQYKDIKQVKSNINLFRSILNQYFQQKLPLLKDEYYFVDEVNNHFTSLDSIELIPHRSTQ